MKQFLALNLSDDVFIMLIDAEMLTIIDILTFLSRINFVLNQVEYEKKFYNFGACISALVLHTFLFIMGPIF